MKKSVISALTTALVVGATATTFAAANPFSDVPAGHWAYNSVTKLASEGIIEGYGDGTFLGNRNITRYEMAQMIAKALAKNPQGASKAELDKLAAEFREELDNLGVRVAELEKHADKVKWGGKIEYTYHNRRGSNGLDGVKSTGNGYVFRLEPVAEINSHWTARARLDSEGDMSTDDSNHTTLKRAWAQADYEKFQAKIGKFEFYTNEQGLIWDTEISGAQVTFGSKWKGTVVAGRLSEDTVAPAAGSFFNSLNDTIYLGYNTNPNGSKDGDHETNVVGINIQYSEPKDKGFFGGASWYSVRDHDLEWVNGKEDDNKANVWGVNLGYRFSPMAKLSGGYVNNTKAQIQKNAWQAEFRYGNYNDAKERGQWFVSAGYRKFGYGVSFAGTTEDDILLGYKGWFINAAYAPWKNIGIILKYGDNKSIDFDNKVRHFFARAEFFF